MKSRTNRLGMLLSLVLLLVLADFALTSTTAHANPLSAYKWKKRPVVLFADTKLNPAYKNQKRLIANNRVGMRMRDQILVEIIGSKVSIDGRVVKRSAAGFRKYYGVSPKVFRFVLVGKDGGVKRKSGKVQNPAAWFCQIDRMPMRKNEMAARAQRSAC